MLRTQVCRPALCDYDCEIMQEWDDEDDPPVVRTVGLRKQCARHRGLSEKAALAAIAEQDRLEGKVWAAVGDAVSPDEVTAGLRMQDDGTLHVTLPTLRADHAKRVRAALADEKVVVK